MVLKLVVLIISTILAYFLTLRIIDFVDKLVEKKFNKKEGKDG